MDKNKKIKGVTFLETLLCATILLIISSFLILKITKNNEKLDLEKSRRVIQSIFIKYTNKSMLKKERYVIEFDLLEKNLKIRERNQTKILEEIYLPTKLKYEIPYNNNRTTKMELETTKDGNISKAFTLYTFGYLNQVENRMAFFVFQKEKVLKINIYLNKSVKDVNYRNIIEYHYSESGQNRQGWEEEY